MMAARTPTGKPPADAAHPPLRSRALAWAQRGWRPAGTLIAIALALLMTWHVIYGKDGLSFWQRKRAQDHELQRQIQDLQQENAEMQQQIEQLKTDPNEIEREARQKLHYARPGEVIYMLPAQPQSQALPSGAGK
jgi:cell division protein FtsB